MKRREFLRFGALAYTAIVALKSLGVGKVFAADAKKAAAKKPETKGKIADKDVMKDGQPATIANYCSDPEKQPHKACPGWKEKPGHCKACMFFNKDNSLADYKGGKVAHCQLLTDATKAQYVSENGWCSTFVAAPPKA